MNAVFASTNGDIVTAIDSVTDGYLALLKAQGGVAWLVKCNWSAESVANAQIYVVQSGGVLGDAYKLSTWSLDDRSQFSSSPA